MFAVFNRNYLSSVGAVILTGLFILLGFVLLIVPGIILAIRLSFVSYLVIDRKLSAWEAITTSWEMTKGHGWRIFGIFCLGALIVLGFAVAFVLVFGGLSLAMAAMVAAVPAAGVAGFFLLGLLASLAVLAVLLYIGVWFAGTYAVLYYNVELLQKPQPKDRKKPAKQ